MNFVSDNAFGVAPEILAALSRANEDTAPSYGEDDLTARVQARLCDVFEREVAAFPVVTGTAANALALATICPPYGAIFCHEESHIVVDECAAPEFFSGGARLVQLKGNHGKITPATVSAALPLYRRGVHGVQPAAISITQATELGTAYTPSEISALGELAHREGMALHMDGARFASALVHLRCTPAELTWKCGVDVLSFGATKNGALCAEAVIFFNRDLVRDFELRRKRGGHLLSKMRFISAQLDAYLADDLWLHNARRANELAQQMANVLSPIRDVRIDIPVETNAVFANVSVTFAAHLRDKGAVFYDWTEPANGRVVIRLVLSCLTPEDAVSQFLSVAAESA
jgi:threonine aldolase